MSAQVNSQSVLVVRVAGLGLRFLAGIVDIIVLAPVLLICGTMLRLVERAPWPSTFADLPSHLLELAIEGQPIVFGFIVLAAFVALLYEAVFCALAGATPGQRLLRMRVLTELGEPPGWRRAVTRTAALLAATLPLGLGLLWIGFDREKRGLHDHLARTYVIVERKPPRR